MVGVMGDAECSALPDPGCRASMSFDPSLHQPLYGLLLGRAQRWVRPVPRRVMSMASLPMNREKAITWLRWACVLPAAVLGSFAAQFLAALAGRLVVFAWGSPAESHVVYYLLLVLFYAPKEAGFVVAGANTAPRARFVVATVLAVVGMLISLIVHIVRQSHPGVVNYTHVAVECTGSALGLAYVLYCARRVRVRRPSGEIV